MPTTKTQQFAYLITGLLGLIFIHEGSIGFLGALVLSFFILIILICSVLEIILHKTLEFKIVHFISRMLLFTCTINFILFFITSRIQDNINQKNGDFLVKKIELFKKDKKVYPDNLKMLVPKYLSSIPYVWTGVFPKKFSYYRTNEGEKNLEYYFILEYYGYIGVEYTYDSRNRHWDEGD